MSQLLQSWKRAFLLGAGVIPIALLAYWFFFVRPYIRMEKAHLATSLVEVRTDVPGKLLKLCEEGTWIEEGETLFSLNSAKEEEARSELQAQIDSLQVRLSHHLAEVEAAMQEYLKARTDQALGLTDQSEFSLVRLQEHQTLADQCKKELSYTGQQLERTAHAIQEKSRAAAISGFVVKRQKQESEELQVGDSVCLLCNPKALWIEAIAPESCASKIQIGQKAFASLPADPSCKWKGALVWISPIALPGHEGIPIRVALEEGYPECLRPNLQVQLTLKVR